MPKKKDYYIFYAAFSEKEKGIILQYVRFCSLIIMNDISAEIPIRTKEGSLNPKVSMGVTLPDCLREGNEVWA